MNTSTAMKTAYAQTAESNDWILDGLLRRLLYAEESSESDVSINTIEYLYHSIRDEENNASKSLWEWKIPLSGIIRHDGVNTL